MNAARGGTEAARLALMAFTATFYGWALLGPLGPELQEDLGLSDVQLSSRSRCRAARLDHADPDGRLSARYGGRTGSPGCSPSASSRSSLLGFVHDSFGAIIVLGFLLGAAGSSFAIGVPFVNRWYPPERQGAALGMYGAGMGGTVLAGLTAPRIADKAGIPRPSSSPRDRRVVLVGVGRARARCPGAPQGGLDARPDRRAR